MESYGTGEPMLLFMGAHIFGECEQYGKTSWLIVTETGEGNHQDASPSRNKGIGYSSRLGNMYANFNALISGGAKGIFQYNMMPGRGCQEPWTDAVSRDPRQLEWLATYRRILENAPELVDYKPPAYYRFPAHFNPNSMELYSEPNADFYSMGGWWWREPVERAENDIWILPSFSLRPESPMFIVNLENKPASERFRAELEQALRDRQRITMIGFRRDLGTIPSVDRYYTGRYSIDKDGRRFQVLRPTKTSRVLGKNGKGEVWNLIDGKLQIQSKEVFGRHGYRPEYLAVGSEKPTEPYYGVFRMLGVEIQNLGPEYEAFSFRDGLRTVTVVSKISGVKSSPPFAIPPGAKCYRPGKTEPTSDLLLMPADLRLVKAHYDWAPEGIMCDTLNARDTLIIESVSAPKLRRRPPERPAPMIAWIEGESRVPAEPSAGQNGCMANNFNYGRMGGMMNLSAGGMLALETAVPPPRDTGWYATYRFSVGSPGKAELWVRESHLAVSSPCEIRIDDGDWIEVPNTLVARDARVVTFYNAVEDTRQIFAWYHYANVNLGSGPHTITFRVTRPRPKGSVITMADDRPYAKMIDCFAFFPRDFKPDGTGGAIGEGFSEPLVNLVEDSSVEFDSDGDGNPDGWTPLSPPLVRGDVKLDSPLDKGGQRGVGAAWTKSEWGSFKIDGLVDLNLTRRESYCGQRALRIEAGTVETCWVYRPIPVKPKAIYELQGWIRRPELASRAGFRLKWLDSAGNEIGAMVGESPDERDWAFYWLQTLAPEGAASAVLECCAYPGSGSAWFDDIVFTMLAPSVEALFLSSPSSVRDTARPR